MSLANRESTKNNALKITLGLTVWLIIQAALSLLHVYHSHTQTLPLRIVLLGVFPANCAILVLLSTNQGRNFIDSLSLVHYSYLNIIRVPLELVLWWLFLNKCVPESMTFEGRNFVIIAGISAPFIAYFGIQQHKLNKQILLGWNFIC